MTKINIDSEYRLKRISEHLYLERWEKDRLFRMYENSNPDTRDIVLRNVEISTRNADFQTKRELRMIIRKH